MFKLLRGFYIVEFLSEPEGARPVAFIYPNGFEQISCLLPTPYADPKQAERARVKIIEESGSFYKSSHGANRWRRLSIMNWAEATPVWEKLTGR